MNHVIVNDMKVIDIVPWSLTDEEGNERPVIPFETAHKILDAWMQQDPTRRGFRYGSSSSDLEPCSVIVMWVVNDMLVIQDLDPFWSPGTDTVNGYDLDALDASLPIDTLKYGEAIGEEI